MRVAVLLLSVSVLATGCDLSKIDLFQKELPPPPPVAEPEPPPPPPPPADPLKERGWKLASVNIDGPLETSLRSDVAPEIAPALSQVTARLLVWWLDVQRDLRRGDRLTVLYEEVPGQEPVVHALKYFSNKLGKEQRAFLFKPEGAQFGRYYDADGQEIEERLEDGPIDHYEQVTSLLRDGRRHKGVDFKAPSGTPVKLPFDAVLTRKNWNFRANGNCLEFKDDRGRRILFLHLSELPKDLKPGKRFRRGEVVAQSGNSGRSTAPHLHYQIENAAGKVLDPFDLHRTYRAKLDAVHTAAYEAHRTELEELLAKTDE